MNLALRAALCSEALNRHRYPQPLYDGEIGCCARPLVLGPLQPQIALRLHERV